MTYWDIPCDGCDGTNVPYMIQRELWKQIVTEKDNYLCLSCVEKRLGRKLVLADFLGVEGEDYSCPINSGMFGFNAKDYVQHGIIQGNIVPIEHFFSQGYLDRHRQLEKEVFQNSLNLGEENNAF